MFGPRQDPTSQYAAVVPRFIRAIAEGRPSPSTATASNRATSRYVENIVAANLLAADAAGAAGRVLNVAAGGVRDRQRPRRHDRRLLGARSRASRTAQPGDVRESWADIAPPARRSATSHGVSFEEGLQRTIEAMLGTKGATVSYAFGTIDELGEGYGFRKVRQALGVEAFGVNVIVMPPHYEGFFHYHDEQDELYFVHAGTARRRGRRRGALPRPRRAAARRLDDAPARLERRRRRPRGARRRREGRIRRPRRRTWSTRPTLGRRRASAGEVAG